MTPPPPAAGLMTAPVPDALGHFVNNGRSYSPEAQKTTQIDHTS